MLIFPSNWFCGVLFREIIKGTYKGARFFDGFHKWCNCTENSLISRFFLIFLGSAGRAPKNDWPDRRDSDDDLAYTITKERLDEIRAQKMYPFYDTGGNNNDGDYQMSIRNTQPQINKQLNFLLPFYGFGFNYTWLSLHG